MATQGQLAAVFFDTEAQSAPTASQTAPSSSSSFLSARRWALACGAIGLGVVGTPLAVSRLLGADNEAFIVPKALVLALSGAAAALLLVKQRQYRPTTSDVCLLACVVHGFLSAVLGSHTWAGAATVLLPEWSALLLLSLVSAAAGEDRARRRRMLDLVILGATLVAAVALLECLGVELPWESVRRPHSTLGNRNFVAAEAAIAAALAGARLLEERSPLRTLGFALLVTIVVVTRCRSAWLGLSLGVVSMLALGWILRPQVPKRAVGYVLGVLLLAGVGAAVTPWPGLHWNDSFAGTAARLVDYQGGTGRERVSDLKIAFSLAKDHPLFGVGPRGWDDAASEHAHQIAGRHATPQHFWTTPNSDLARTLAERGFLGAVLLAGAVAALMVGAWRAKARSRLETLALAGAATVILVDAVLDAPLFGASTLAIAGVLAGLARAPGSKPVVVVRPITGVGLSALALALLLVTSVRTVCSAWLASEPGDIGTMQRAQLWFPRPDVAEVLTFRLATSGRCEEAQRAGEAALELAPHHWGVPHALSKCWLSRGDRAKARWHRAERDRLEPHVDALFSQGADVASGYDSSVDHAARKR